MTNEEKITQSLTELLPLLRLPAAQLSHSAYKARLYDLQALLQDPATKDIPPAACRAMGPELHKTVLTFTIGLMLTTLTDSA